MIAPLEKLRRSVRRSPICNRLLAGVLPLYRILAVRHDTEIVIEGYPRCANTFAVIAFTQSQPQAVKVAHHLHSISQLRRGVELGIPTLVLLRDPREAILSLAIRKQHATPKWAAEEYVDFHSGAAELRDHVLFADFEEVTSDFGAVIRRVNNCYRRRFSEFEHTDENVSKCYEQIDSIERRDAGGSDLRATHVARPSDDRRRSKEAIAALLDSSAMLPLIKEAERLYRALSEARLSQTASLRLERQL